jgi:hypothetical protein
MKTVVSQAASLMQGHVIFTYVHARNNIRVDLTSPWKAKVVVSDTEEASWTTELRS